jgi:hypothetical protein
MTYLEIRNELLDDSFPSYESLNEDITGSQILRGDVLLYKTLVAGDV